MVLMSSVMRSLEIGRLRQAERRPQLQGTPQSRGPPHLLGSSESPAAARDTPSASRETTSASRLIHHVLLPSTHKKTVLIVAPPFLYV